MPQAEAELFVFDLPLFLAEGRKTLLLLHQSPYLPTCKAKADEEAFQAEEPSHAPRVIRFSA